MLPPGLRIKRFRLVLEQRDIEERDFRFWRCETLPLFPSPSLFFYSHHFSRSLSLSFLVLCSETAGKRLLRRLVALCSKRFLGTPSKYCISCHLPLRTTILGPALLFVLVRCPSFRESSKDSKERRGPTR